VGEGEREHKWDMRGGGREEISFELEQTAGSNEFVPKGDCFQERVCAQRCASVLKCVQTCLPAPSLNSFLTSTNLHNLFLTETPALT